MRFKPLDIGSCSNLCWWGIIKVKINMRYVIVVFFQVNSAPQPVGLAEEPQKQVRTVIQVSPFSLSQSSIILSWESCLFTLIMLELKLLLTFLLSLQEGCPTRTLSQVRIHGLILKSLRVKLNEIQAHVGPYLRKVCASKNGHKLDCACKPMW